MAGSGSGHRQGCREIGRSDEPACFGDGAPAATDATAAGISGALSAPRGGKADRLTLIKGIGPVNERKLNDHGVFHFDQIAAWTQADVATAEAYLAFDGRITREDWIGQAARLAQSAAARRQP